MEVTEANCNDALAEVLVRCVELNKYTDTHTVHAYPLEPVPQLMLDEAGPYNYRQLPEGMGFTCSAFRARVSQTIDTYEGYKQARLVLRRGGGFRFERLAGRSASKVEQCLP